MGDQKNLFLAIALAFGVLAIYQIFVAGPAARQRQAQQQAQQQVVQQQAAKPKAEKLAEQVQQQALKSSAILPFSTAAMDGSITQVGTRFDNVKLKRYRTELSPESPEVQVLSPKQGRGGEFGYFGWKAADDGANNTLPGALTEWKLIQGTKLTPVTPLVFQWSSPEGLVFTRTISVDDQYMFTIQDQVANNGSEARTIRPFGEVKHIGNPTHIPKGTPASEKRKLRGSFVSFQGVIGAVGGKNIKYKYRKLLKEGGNVSGQEGWTGFTNKYWLAAAIAPVSEPVQVQSRMIPQVDPTATPVFETTLLGKARTIAPGQSETTTLHFFAGAKKLKVLQAYQHDLHIDRFDMAIDWGLFWFLTRPYFWALEHLYDLVGNFGIAIIMLTFIIKLAFFPIASKSYESMARMKALQPKMDELRERYKDDQQTLQQETMALYQREKVNPFGGCLPMLLQIPVFFALYKTLYITIEMRHTPFFGWIKDLSAPDPTHIGNLFGLLHFDPANVPVLGSVLAIGIWPLIMGVTMGAQQLLNPPAPDPTQRKIFAFMPVIFTIMLAPFAAGLVIYWAWNNFLSLLQQYYITRKNGVETPLDKLLGGGKA